MDISALRSMIEAGLRAARTVPTGSTSAMLEHRARSRAWIEALASAFQQTHAAEPDVRVFYQSNPANRRDFGLNELLHDITVARQGTVLVPRHNKPLSYIREVLWQIESELARDGREALFDFNKLVLGAARHKLFVAPDVHRPDAFLRTLLAPAKACMGRVFLSIVPHPDRWEEPAVAVRLWQLDGDRWVEHQASPAGDVQLTTRLRRAALPPNSTLPPTATIAARPSSGRRARSP